MRLGEWTLPPLSTANYRQSQQSQVTKIATFATGNMPHATVAIKNCFVSLFSTWPIFYVADDRQLSILWPFLALLNLTSLCLPPLCESVLESLVCKVREVYEKWHFTIIQFICVRILLSNKWRSHQAFRFVGKIFVFFSSIDYQPTVLVAWGKYW